MTVLCLHSAAQEQEAETTAGKFLEEACKMLAEEQSQGYLPVRLLKRILLPFWVRIFPWGRT